MDHFRLRWLLEDKAKDIVDTITLAKAILLIDEPAIAEARRLTEQYGMPLKTVDRPRDAPDDGSPIREGHPLSRKGRAKDKDKEESYPDWLNIRE